MIQPNLGGIIDADASTESETNQTAIADEAELLQQQIRHLDYVATVSQTQNIVEQYIRERAGDAPSSILGASALDVSEKASEADENRVKEELQKAIAEAAFLYSVIVGVHVIAA